VLLWGVAIREDLALEERGCVGLALSARFALGAKAHLNNVNVGRLLALNLHAKFGMGTGILN
jgi:hypothetical protein